MNGFIEIIFLSLLLFLTFYFGKKTKFDFMNIEKLNTDGKARVIQKFVIVLVVFMGYFILQLMAMPFEKTHPDLGEVVVKCLLTTLFAFLGVTLYFDVIQLIISRPTKEGATKMGVNLMVELIAVIGSIISFSYFTNLGPRVDVLTALQAVGSGAFNIGKSVGTGIVNVGKEVGESYIETGKKLVESG